MVKEFLHRFSGFPPCDGVGGTLKTLAAWCYLPETSKQNLTPIQLFEFANSEITVVTSYFVKSQSVKEMLHFWSSGFQMAAPSRELFFLSKH